MNEEKTKVTVGLVITALFIEAICWTAYFVFMLWQSIKKLLRALRGKNKRTKEVKP